jgi:hypothetical protein
MLKPILDLIYVNFAFSVLVSLVAIVLQYGSVDSQIQHSNLPAGVALAQVNGAGIVLQITLWGKLGTMVLLSLIYIWQRKGLQRGAKRPYISVYAICAIGFAGFGYLMFADGYPTWMRIEQGVQAAILLVQTIWVIRNNVQANRARKAARAPRSFLPPEEPAMVRREPMAS